MSEAETAWPTSIKCPQLEADTEGMAHTPTLFYNVIVERYRGITPNDMQETLECENFYFASPEEACEKARTVIASAPAPVLLPDGVELTQAFVESFYYVDEDGGPMPPKSLAECRALEEAEEALLVWGGEWEDQMLEQALPPEIAEVLAEREPAAYEEWAATGR